MIVKGRLVSTGSAGQREDFTRRRRAGKIIAMAPGSQAASSGRDQRRPGNAAWRLT